MREFAEQQAENVQEAQREQFATLTLNTAVELTAAALSQIALEGAADAQAAAMRDAMRVLFPEAVALVSAARQGFMREKLRRDLPTAILPYRWNTIAPPVARPRSRDRPAAAGCPQARRAAALVPLHRRAVAR